jgi:hypothetical protein
MGKKTDKKSFSNLEELMDGTDNVSLSRLKKEYLTDSLRAWQNSNRTAGLSQLPAGHRRTSQVTVNFNTLPSEKVIQNEGSFIVLGKDRPRGAEPPGYGAINPGGRSSTIDLVVGRQSSGRGGKGPKDGTYTDNNFFTDAARVYISQMTDVDLNFGISEGMLKNSVARSAVAIKADGIRIIGREGVKIVTGRTHSTGAGPKGETNSFGGKLEPAPPIELIAGNNGTGHRSVIAGLFGLPKKINYLQPALMGETTVDCLKELTDMVDKINGSVTNLAAILSAYMAFDGIDPLRPWVPAIAGFSTTVNLTDVLAPLWGNKTGLWFLEANYLEKYGSESILSRNVYIT